jgi:peroxiredoxin
VLQIDTGGNAYETVGLSDLDGFLDGSERTTFLIDQIGQMHKDLIKYRFKFK